MGEGVILMRYEFCDECFLCPLKGFGIYLGQGQEKLLMGLGKKSEVGILEN